MNLSRHRMRRYWGLLSRFKWTVALLSGLAVFSMTVALLQPYLFHHIIDEIALKDGLSREQKSARLFQAGVMLVLLLSLSLLAHYVHAYRTIALNHKITARLRYRVLKHMLSLPLHELAKIKTGGAVARLNQDTVAVSQIVNRGLITPVVACLQIVTALGLVFLLNWKMSVAAVAVILPLAALTQLFGKRLRPLFVEVSRLGSELAARSTEMFSGVRVSRIYRRELAERRAYLRIYHRIIRKTLAARRGQIAIDSFWMVAFNLIQIVIVVVGVHLIIRGQATVGDILAIIMYSNRIMGPIEQVVHAYQQLQEDLASMDRIFEILAMKPDELDRPHAVDAPADVQELRFEQVGFYYNGNGRTALSNITFRVPGGTTVALVGKSGAGKSTLTDLLSRFYDPQEGAIYLNGCDLRDIKVDSYRGLLGVVQQDVFLFDGSVRDNIAYARPRATHEEIVTAAVRANAQEFILELPQRYDTMIGERGIKLSGGQKQRISIARAFLVDPAILIMDEATSNLDTESEQTIQHALQELLQGRTTFIIAHRLSTVTHADVIVVLHEGSISEMGKHDELMSRRGRYFHMIERQRHPMLLD